MNIDQQTIESQPKKKVPIFKYDKPFRDPMFLNKEERKELQKKLVTRQEIFSNIINKNEGQTEYTNLNELATNEDLNTARLADLPQNIQKEILAKLPLDVQERAVLNNFSFEHCKYLVEHYGENSLIAYHVSPSELKVGDKLEPSAKDPYLYFSTDIKNLFLPVKPRWIYAFKISNKEAAMGKYNDSFPEFGRLHGSYRIEDAIKITEDNWKKLGAKYSEYKAAGRKDVNETGSYDPEKNSELRY